MSASTYNPELAAWVHYLEPARKIWRDPETLNDVLNEEIDAGWRRGVLSEANVFALQRRVGEH